MTPRDVTPEPAWQCFHCGEVFTDKAEAREHFGADELKTPLCCLSVEDGKRLRELEDANAELRRENDHLENDARLYHELSAEVHRRTNGHGLFMHLDYVEGEKLVLQEKVAALEAENERLRAVPRATPPAAERVAQMIAHRVCTAGEHKPWEGKTHGCCIVCGETWPCLYAGPRPPATPPAEDALRLLSQQLRDIARRADVSLANDDPWDAGTAYRQSAHEVDALISRSKLGPPAAEQEPPHGIRKNDSPEIAGEMPEVQDAVGDRHRAIRGNDLVLPKVPEDCLDEADSASEGRLLSTEVTPEPSSAALEACKGTCNPFTAACGAKFCTYEEKAQHQEECRASSPSDAPKPTYRCAEWDILEAMRVYGGGFVQQLAILYRLADRNNQRTLEAAFRNYFVKYDEMAATADAGSSTPEKKD